MSKKKVDENVVQLYTVRIDRVRSNAYGKVSIGTVEFVLREGKIKEAYAKGREKGINIFGEEIPPIAGIGEYNVVQLRINPMNRIE